MVSSELELELQLKNLYGSSKLELFVWLKQAQARTFFYSFEQAQARRFCNVSSKLKLKLGDFVMF